MFLGIAYTQQQDWPKALTAHNRPLTVIPPGGGLAEFIWVGRLHNSSWTSAGAGQPCCWPSG
jgi:hypothetical protein